MIALTASGCSSWQTTHLAPPAQGAPAESSQVGLAELASPSPARLRLQLKDGSVVVLNYPRIDGDSLRGINVPGPAGPRAFDVRPEPLGRVPRAVALNDIAQVESKHFSGPKSLLMVLTTVGLVYLGLLFAYGMTAGRAF